MKNTHGLALFHVSGEESSWVVAASSKDAIALHHETICGFPPDCEDEPVAKEVEEGPGLDAQLAGDAEPGETLRSLFLNAEVPQMLAATIQ